MALDKRSDRRRCLGDSLRSVTPSTVSIAAYITVFVIFAAQTAVFFININGRRAAATTLHATLLPQSSFPTARVDLAAVATSDEGPSARRLRSLGRPILPACARDAAALRPRTFLMVFSGHSGSTAMASELQSHPDVYMGTKEMVERPGLIDNETAALEATRAFFKQGLARNLTPGFKIRPFHIMRDPDGWAALAREFNTRIIWQYRRNVVKQSVGRYSGRVLGDISATMGITAAERASRCKVGAGCSFNVTDFEAFHLFMRKALFNTATIVNASVILDGGRDCMHELPYEDYLYDSSGTMSDLQRFLGLRLVHTKPKFFKATNDSMCNVVSNFEELCRAFYGCTVWRPFFHDGHNQCTCRISASPKHFCTTEWP